MLSPFTTKQVAQGSSDSKPQDAHDVVSQFYANYNSNNIDGILDLMAEDCSYHDTVYLEPFVGKEAIRGYFEKVSSIVPSELQFHIENMTTGDPHNVGVRWCVPPAVHMRLQVWHAVFLAVRVHHVKEIPTMLHCLLYPQMLVLNHSLKCLPGLLTSNEWIIHT